MKTFAGVTQSATKPDGTEIALRLAFTDGSIADIAIPSELADTMVLLLAEHCREASELREASERRHAAEAGRAVLVSRPTPVQLLREVALETIDTQQGPTQALRLDTASGPRVYLDLRPPALRALLECLSMAVRAFEQAEEKPN